jgi:hypothetical protein
MLTGCPHADNTAENLELNPHTRETIKKSNTFKSGHGLLG